MFRRDRLGRRGGGVILYVKESIQAYEIKLEMKPDYNEAVWCKIVSGNSKLTIGLVYRSPNSGNIISDGFQMVEVLNEYFSSVFTTEDISSLPFHLLNFRAINQNI